MSEHLDTETLSAHLDGRSGGDAARIDAHLGSCASCAARQASMQRVMRSVAALPPVATTTAERSALRSAVLAGARSGGREPAAPSNRWRQRITWKLYAAAGAVAGLLAGGIAYAAFEGGQAAVTASGAGHRARQAIEAKQFANSNEVVVFVAHQPSVTGTVRALTAAGIPERLQEFENALAATPKAAANAPGSSGATGSSGAAASGAQPKSAAAPGPLAPLFGPVAPAPSAGVPAESAPDSAPLPPPVGTLATCVSGIASGVGVPTAPLEATEITFQGMPAWLIVLAAFPPGASGATRPASVEIWVQARPACSPLAHSSLAP